MSRPSPPELEELAFSVARRMMSLRDPSFAEPFPVSLVDMGQWEWPQGVGLYGIYRLYRRSRDECLLSFLDRWYEERLASGLPERNVNTSSPLLTLVDLYRETGKAGYRELCLDWGGWLMDGLPRAGEEALFQHTITGSLNEGQALIDTLFMACLFLAKAGAEFGRPEWVEESARQFLVHVRRLFDPGSGLFFHGCDAVRGGNYGAVRWGRGNAWYACGLAELLEVAQPSPACREELLAAWRAQAAALLRLQDGSGLWHTVLDDPGSYLETSASAGIGYGMLKGSRLGLGGPELRAAGERALAGVVARIDGEGSVQGVSYGTPVGMDAAFYKSIPRRPMTYGQALALLLLVEALEGS
ncbi:MAG TPA: glycoside hydrolase family 88 protein [Spirochaetales bacterium]|nr:glycoside hydrolase family 88 protein [Spirochaetales bacterium]